MVVNVLLGFHFRGPSAWARGAVINAFPSAAEPERGLLGGAHVEGRTDVPDRPGSLSGRKNLVDERTGRSGPAFVEHGAATHRNEASGGGVSAAARSAVLAKLSRWGEDGWAPRKKAIRQFHLTMSNGYN